jgi:hypothetical protein
VIAGNECYRARNLKIEEKDKRASGAYREREGRFEDGIVRANKTCVFSTR